MAENENIIRCLIIDDEPPAQRVLEKYISELPFLKLEGKCMNVFEASGILHQKPVDLIFLDINMPKMSGMEFLRTMKNPPAVIITTAYSEFALEGYELNVTDYLQKPIGFDRFFQAVHKVSLKVNALTTQGAAIQTAATKSSFHEFLFLREDKIDYKVNVQDIMYLESVGDYVKVHTLSKTHLVYQTLKNFEKLLDPKLFIRIHKSFMIPFSRIEYIEGNMVKIAGQTLPIGVTFKNNFFEALRQYKMI